jgi:hypothetical protein
MASQLLSLISSPASNLLSGLIGAVVGVVGLFAIQGLQSRAERQAAQPAARSIYLEIGYNVAAIQAPASATTSSPLSRASPGPAGRTSLLATATRSLANADQTA